MLELHGGEREVEDVWLRSAAGERLELDWRHVAVFSTSTPEQVRNGLEATLRESGYEKLADKSFKKGQGVAALTTTDAMVILQMTKRENGFVLDAKKRTLVQRERGRILRASFYLERISRMTAANTISKSPTLTKEVVLFGSHRTSVAL